MLRPEEREDGQLEVVRVALEQRPDAIELRVRQAENAVERLFRDAAQRAILDKRCGRSPGGSTPGPW